MKLFFFGVWSLLVLNACGDANSFAPAKAVAKHTCPAEVQTPEHYISVHLSKPMPSHPALYLEGELKFDSCPKQRAIFPPAPLATLEIGANAIGVHVRHYGAYSTRPETVSFEIKDRQGCDQEPTTFFKAEKVPLKWALRFSNGPDCAGEWEANAVLQQQ